MDRKKFSTVFIVLLIAPVLAIINFLILKYLAPAGIYDSFRYPIPVLYAVFTVASILILLIQIRIKQTSPDLIGYVFLVTTSVKTALAYAMLHPVLDLATESARFEKINFFVIFILFLAIEVVLTSKLLKDVDKKG